MHLHVDVVDLTASRIVVVHGVQTLERIAEDGIDAMRRVVELDSIDEGVERVVRRRIALDV